MPGAFFKTTKSRNFQIEKTKENKKPAFNTATFEHIVGKNIHPSSYVNESIVNHMTGLRSHKQDKDSHRKAFSAVPFKNRKNYPELIKKVILY